MNRSSHTPECFCNLYWAENQAGFVQMTDATFLRIFCCCCGYCSMPINHFRPFTTHASSAGTSVIHIHVIPIIFITRFHCDRIISITVFFSWNSKSHSLPEGQLLCAYSIQFYQLITQFVRWFFFSLSLSSPKHPKFAQTQLLHVFWYWLYITASDARREQC